GRHALVVLCGPEVVDLVVGGVEEVFGGRRGRVGGVDEHLCRRQSDRGRPLHETLWVSGVGGVERLLSDGSDLNDLATKDLAGCEESETIVVVLFVVPVEESLKPRS